MDNYTVVLLLGGIGLVAMAVTGLGRHGHGGGTHGHGGHAPGGHHVAGGAHGHDAGHQLSPAWQLMSPRIIFSILFGVGVAGKIFRPLLGGIPLLLLAIAGGLAFERFLAMPIWNFVMRFGSNPAMTLESAITGEATVVSSFDAKGDGLVAVEINGHLVQLLATLQSSENASGTRVRAGDRVRIEDIDAARNRCTVSRL
jgi:hypothetical protein